jgi:hypothetical protein
MTECLAKSAGGNFVTVEFPVAFSAVTDVTIMYLARIPHPPLPSPTEP